MKGLDDGPDGLNEKAFDRALGVTTERLPSIKQMAQRCLPFHRRILVALVEGVKVDSPQWQAGDYRGLRTAIGTLSKWRCVAEGRITERGRELLALLSARAKEAK